MFRIGQPQLPVFVPDGKHAAQCDIGFAAGLSIDFLTESKQVVQGLFHRHRRDPSVLVHGIKIIHALVSLINIEQPVVNLQFVMDGLQNFLRSLLRIRVDHHL